MTEQYYLFRGDALIYQPKAGHGAGDSHKQGQPGDVLINMENGLMAAWYWQKGDKMGHQAHWDRIKDPTIVPKYRVLLLLQT